MPLTLTLKPLPVITGGLETTKQLVATLKLQQGQRMLDVGCGPGGADFHIAEQHGVHVHGLDLSVNMIMLALERAVERQGDVTFEVADCTTRDFADDCFDVVFSRDVLLHIHDKPSLFKRWVAGSAPPAGKCRDSLK